MSRYFWIFARGQLFPRIFNFCKVLQEKQTKSKPSSFRRHVTRLIKYIKIVGSKKLSVVIPAGALCRGNNTSSSCHVLGWVQWRNTLGLGPKQIFNNATKKSSGWPNSELSIIISLFIAYDLSAAFDTGWHMSHFEETTNGFQQAAMKWMSSYLAERKQSVTSQGEISKFQDVTPGACSSPKGFLINLGFFD